jgi:hypothetical protein
MPGKCAYCGMQHRPAQHYPAPLGRQFNPSACSPRRKDAKSDLCDIAYGDFIYYIKKEDHPYRAFFRRFVARLLYLDTSWGGCSGFVDCIIGLLL